MLIQPQLHDLVSVSTWGAAYDHYHDRYQQYYATGLRQVLAKNRLQIKTIPLQRRPGLLRSFRFLRSSSRLKRAFGPSIGKAIDGVAGMVGGKRKPPSGEFHPLVEQYHFLFADGGKLRLAIDAADGGEICSERQISDCDIYAKSNYRLDLTYPAKVFPICNGNPFILPHIDELRTYRGQQTTTDVCFIVRVWEGREDAEGVEHNLRLLEAVNHAKCSKRLLAYLVAANLEKQENRLRMQGIPTTRAPMPLRALWDASASASINVIRLGMHNCIPWRFVDLLAMGSCIVVEQPPQTVWSLDLVEGQHFMHLGVLTTPDRPLATDEQYREIPERIEQLVADQKRQKQIRSESANYFDRHACPEAVGRHLLEHVLQHREETR